MAKKGDNSLNKDLIVRKANSLIEASYRLSIDEVRILALTIGTMDSYSNQQIFDFTIDDFVREFPEITRDNAYKQIQAAMKRIYERSVKTEDEYRKTEFRWVSSRSYFATEGRFQICLTNEIMPYLTQLKGQFTPYRLNNISRFNSVNSVRIYELCTQYLSIGTRKISVERLKHWLQVADKYTFYHDFKKRILSPALDEINAKSDLTVSIEEIKNGRKVEEIEFTISLSHSVIGEMPPKNVVIDNVDYTVEPNTPNITYRRIFGVFDEITRPQVMKGSAKEGEWATNNLNRAYDILKKKGLLAQSYLFDDDIKQLPTEWLRVIKRFTSITDTYTAKAINKELEWRKSGNQFEQIPHSSIAKTEVKNDNVNEMQDTESEKPRRSLMAMYQQIVAENAKKKQENSIKQAELNLGE